MVVGEEVRESGEGVWGESRGSGERALEGSPGRGSEGLGKCSGEEVRGCAESGEGIRGGEWGLRGQ